MNDKIIEYVYAGPSDSRLLFVCKQSEHPKAPVLVDGILAYRCNAHPSRVGLYEKLGHPFWITVDGEIVEPEVEDAE